MRGSIRTGSSGGRSIRPAYTRGYYDRSRSRSVKARREDYSMFHGLYSARFRPGGSHYGDYRAPRRAYPLLLAIWLLACAALAWKVWP